MAQSQQYPHAVLAHHIKGATFPLPLPCPVLPSPALACSVCAPLPWRVLVCPALSCCACPCPGLSYLPCSALLYRNQFCTTVLPRYYAGCTAQIFCAEVCQIVTAACPPERSAKKTTSKDGAMPLVHLMQSAAQDSITRCTYCSMSIICTLSSLFTILLQMMRSAPLLLFQLLSSIRDQHASI